MELTRRSLLAATAAVLLPLAPVRAAESKAANAPAAGQDAGPDAPYTRGPVWELSFIRIVPGMGDDYLKSLATTWKRSLDEAKKEGVVVSYKIISGLASGPDDWDLLLMVEFKSWAALDGAEAKMRAIEAKIVGNPDQTRTVMTKRLEVRHILGEKLAQELFLK